MGQRYAEYKASIREQVAAARLAGDTLGAVSVEPLIERWKFNPSLTPMASRWEGGLSVAAPPKMQGIAGIVASAFAFVGGVGLGGSGGLSSPGGGHSHKAPGGGESSLLRSFSLVIP